MTFEKVLEIFKEQIKLDNNMEIIKFRHGYRIFIWDNIEQDYHPNGELITSPRELFNALLYETEHFLELKYTDPSTDRLDEIHKSEIKRIVSDLKNAADIF